MSAAAAPGRSGLAAYLAVAFVLAWAGQILILVNGGIDGPWFGTLAPLVMFTPAVAAAVALRVERASFRSVLRWGGGVRLLVAVFVPVIAALLANAVIHHGLGGTPPAVVIRDGRLWVPEHGYFLRSGGQNLLVFALNVLGSGALLALQGGLLAVGEEIGWRGYLQPRLCAAAGTIRGLIGVGLLWSLWHLPLLLGGYVFPASPVLGGLVLFPIVGVALSWFLGWLTLRSGSIWPAVLAHGSYNAAFGVMIFGMDFGNETRAAYAVIVAVSAATGAVFAVLLARGPRAGGGPTGRVESRESAALRAESVAGPSRSL